MGKLKPKHNWKARQKFKTTVDRSEENQIKIESKDLIRGIDESNALAPPSKKRHTKNKQAKVNLPPKLSKTKRKKLEKVLASKDKKEKRAKILEELKTVQISSEERDLLTSTKELHSQKYKRELSIVQNDSGKIVLDQREPIKKRFKHTEHITDSSSCDDELSSDENDDLINEYTNRTQISYKQPSPGAKSDLNKTPNRTEDKPKTSTETENVKKNQTDPQGLKENSNLVTFVPVNRTESVQTDRLKLPILSEEQVIMEAIKENPVCVLCGETGSGKTTQVPQFLYEAGFTSDGRMIGVTEPRRVAAISMSKRVAHEMNLPTSQISYQIRYEGNTGPNTQIKFMTDGVLMKEVQNNFLLTKYSCIIIDEAHERSVYSDILIGLLSRIVPLRYKRKNPLKLIIMSATLRVEDFTENLRLFPSPPPVIRIDSRQYPVTTHFNKITQEDYLGEAYKKVCKIHRQLPSGGILVFLTSQQEVHTLCKRLRSTFSSKSGQKQNHKRKKEFRRKKSVELPKISLDSYSILPADEDELGVDLDSGDSDDDLYPHDECGSEDDQSPEMSLHVLPLYGLLSTERQALVFKKPPANTRLVVVATNIAETSLTIPDIKYVVDSGKVKSKFFDKLTGVSTFRVVWTSKASADQRAGRAGRTAEGHTYRLYSSAVFNDFETFSPAEITRRPVEDLVLQMKHMGIEKVVNFPFPTPPDLDALKTAEALLINLKALKRTNEALNFQSNLQLQRDRKSQLDARITDIGKTIASFPVLPRFGKMLILASELNVLEYVIPIIAALSVQEPLVNVHNLPPDQLKNENIASKLSKFLQLHRLWAGNGESLLLGDLMVLLKAVGATEFSGCTPDFCADHGLRLKAMIEIRKLRSQLTNAVNTFLHGVNVSIDPKMPPPSDQQINSIRCAVLSGLADRVAKRLPDPTSSEDSNKFKHAYQAMELEDPVFIHPSSALHTTRPVYVVYQQIEETSKLYMKGVTAIDSDWLPIYADAYCQFSEPDESSIYYEKVTGAVRCKMASLFGPRAWEIEPVDKEHPNNINRVKWFSMFLLNGEVFVTLKKYVSTLLSTPSTMIKSWANLQPRTEVLLTALVSENISCKNMLSAKWTVSPKFLLKEYLNWVPEILHKDVREHWPPVE